MVAISFSSSALVLLLLVLISSATQIDSSYGSVYVDTTSRASKKPPIKRPINPKPNPKLKKGKGPKFYAVKDKWAEAVWRGKADLAGGTPANSRLKNMRGWDQIEKEIRAAGGKIAGPKGGASDRARCHLIGDDLGGKGIRKNLFTCFAYFNFPGMYHFERLLRKEIESLRGNERCRMVVTLKYTTKEYPTSVNMNAKCKGKQFFNVNISNEFPDSNVKIEHLCRPTIPLKSGGFRGTVSVVSNASSC